MLVVLGGELLAGTGRRTPVLGAEPVRAGWSPMSHAAWSESLCTSPFVAPAGPRPRRLESGQPRPPVFSPLLRSAGVRRRCAAGRRGACRSRWLGPVIVYPWEVEECVVCQLSAAVVAGGGTVRCRPGLHGPLRPRSGTGHAGERGGRPPAGPANARPGAGAAGRAGHRVVR